MHRYSSSFSILSPVCGATLSIGGGHKGPPRRGRADRYSARPSPAARRAASDRRTRRARILSRGTNHAEWYGCALGKRPQVPPGQRARDRTTPPYAQAGGGYIPLRRERPAGVTPMKPRAQAGPDTQQDRREGDAARELEMVHSERAPPPRRPPRGDLGGERGIGLRPAAGRFPGPRSRESPWAQ